MARRLHEPGLQAAIRPRRMCAAATRDASTQAITTHCLTPLSNAAMVDRQTFDLIKKEHGAYASWAVWADRAGRLKSGMGDLSVLDPDQNPTLLQKLRNDMVMVALNSARFSTERCASESGRPSVCRVLCGVGGWVSDQARLIAGRCSG